jgi:hypothetical protein
MRIAGKGYNRPEGQSGQEVKMGQKHGKNEAEIAGNSRKFHSAPNDFERRLK